MTTKKSRNKFEGEQKFEHIGDIEPVPAGAFIGDWGDYDFEYLGITEPVRALNGYHAEFVALKMLLRASASRFDSDHVCDNCGAAVERVAVLRNDQRTIAVGIDCARLISSNLNEKEFDRRKKERAIAKSKNGKYFWTMKISVQWFWVLWKSADRPSWLRVSKTTDRDKRGRLTDNVVWFAQIWGDTREDVAVKLFQFETLKEKYKTI